MTCPKCTDDACCWICSIDFIEPTGPIDPDDNPDSDERPDYDY